MDMIALALTSFNLHISRPPRDRPFARTAFRFKGSINSSSRVGPHWSPEMRGIREKGATNNLQKPGYLKESQIF